MAIYGIASAGSLSGSSVDDTLQFLNPDTARLSGSTVLGLEGNDLLYLGPNGYTAVASGTITQPALAETASGTLALTLVNSAGSTTTTTTYQFETGAATGITVDLTGIVTADRGVRTLYASQIYGNQGNDSIYLGAEISDVSASTVGGGAGNDVIGNYTFVDASAGSLTASAMSAGTFSNSFVEAGGGDDTIKFVFSGTTLATSTFQGSQGNDNITLTTTVSTGDSVQVLGGGGDDTISGTLGDALQSGITVAGGGGADTIFLNTQDDINQSLISLDTFNSLSTYDGADFFSGVFVSAFSGVTLQAGGGNDTVILTGLYSEGGNQFSFQEGDDRFSASKLSADTVYAGAGNDSIAITDGIKSGFIALGGGNDSIQLSGNAESTTFQGTTIYGGAGADLIQSGDWSIASGTVQFEFEYATATDSVLGGSDTIAIGSDTFSGGFQFEWVPANASLSSFSGSQLSGTDGIVAFSGTWDNGPTSRVEALDGLVTTEGSTVAFSDGNGRAYLFIQGGSSDLLVTLASADGIAALTVSGGSDIDLTVS